MQPLLTYHTFPELRRLESKEACKLVSLKGRVFLEVHLLHQIVGTKKSTQTDERTNPNIHVILTLHL